MPEVGKTRLKKSWGRNWGLFLISLLFAFLIWFVHNLSQEYSVYMQYRLVVTTSINGHVPVSTANEALLMRGKARGFFILQHRNRQGAPMDLAINLSPDLFSKIDSEKDMYLLNTANLGESLSEALGSQVTVEYIETKEITFYFPSQSNKRVPIVAQTSITLQEQYMQTQEISLSPDSVTIYGVTENLEKINSVKTKMITRSSVSKSIQGVVKLEPIKGFRMDEEQIYYTLDVARYVEQTATIKLDVINLPKGKSVIILPSQVQVRYRIPFDRRDDTAIPTFVVDYHDIEGSRSSKVIPRLLKTDMTLYRYEVEPTLVECLLREDI